MRWTTRLSVLASLAFPAAVVAQVQTGRVTGIVTDSGTALPVASATVLIVGTQLGAQTGPDGRFTINGVPAGSQQVRAQRIGFAPQVRTVAVTAGQTIGTDFQLRAQAVQLEAVVSVGYGTQSLRDVAGAVSSVTTEALEHAPVATLDQMLQGTAPGVQVTTASSEPGGALSIRIRGMSSLTGNSEPLYVVDGFPIENDIEGESVGNGGRSRTTPPNPLSTLNPNDIESISILKDASATAIYGARGANGVVIITTKQGRGTKPTFTFDSYAGASTLAKRYDLLDAKGYMDYANAYGQAQSTPFTPFPDSVYNRILQSGINTDWQDQIFRTGPVRNANATLRGATNGANVTRYAASGGYFDQQGIVLGSGLRRFSTRLNLDQSLGSRFEFGGSLNAAQARSRSTPTSGQQNGNAGAVSAALQYVPIMPVRRADGTYSYINTDLNAFNSQLNAPTTPNPVALATDVTDSLSDTRLLTNFFGQANLLRDLQLRVTLGADYANRSRNTYYPSTVVGTSRGAATNGGAIRASGNTASYLNENTLTYHHAFGSQDLTVLGGFSVQGTTQDGQTITNTNFVSDITEYFDIGAGTPAGGPSVSSYQTRQHLESFLGRVNYSLLDRYLLTLTYREDGSSRFAANKKWGGFPSAAFAWRLSSEPFMRHIKAIDELKLRTSYGVVGNPSIRPYQSLTHLGSQTYSFGGTAVSGYSPTVLGNPNLTWESTRQFDGGFDLGLWQRLTLTADYYRKRTTDLLLQVQLPLEQGFETVLANRGSIRNEGVELGLDGDVMKGSGKAFRWHSNVSFAKNRNKVLDLGGPSQIFGTGYELITSDFNFPGTLIMVGKPIGEFYGFKSLGVVRDSAQAASITYRNFSGGKFKPGDELIANMDGDTLITLNDRVPLGDPTPKFTYGWTNTFSWRAFQLTGLIQGQHGGKILNVNRVRTEGSPRVNVEAARWYDRWTPDNPNAKYPVVTNDPTTVGPNNFSSAILEDASYLRLKSVTLSFILPTSLASRAHATDARLYVTGTNLWTKTNYSGFDPDVSAQSVGNVNRGIDIGAYPLARTIITGVSFTF